MRPEFAGGFIMASYLSYIGIQNKRPIQGTKDPIWSVSVYRVLTQL